MNTPQYKWPYLRWILKAVSLYAPGLIVIMLLYFLLIGLVQGQDVLMQIGEYSGPVIWSLVCVIALSAYLWYSSRLLSIVKLSDDENIMPESWLLHGPRLLAFNAVVCLQAAGWALPTIANLGLIPIIIFVIGQQCMYAVFVTLARRTGKKALARVIFLLVFFGYTGFAVYYAQKEEWGHQVFIPLINLFLYIYSFIMTYWFVARRDEVDSARKRPKFESSSQFRFFQRLFPVTANDTEVFYFTFFNYFVGLGLIVYVTAFFWIYLASSMGALAFTLLALGILTGLANLISTVCIRRDLNLFLLLFLMAWGMGFLYDYYNVDVLEVKREDRRPDLIRYFDGWLEEPVRKDILADGSVKSFTVYLVIADGGASRSGYWVSSVLSALEDSTVRDKSIPTRFSDHLFCLSGASGGSVGNAAFYSELLQFDSARQLLPRTRTFLSSDFLTPVLTRWLGSDIIQHFLPLALSNRAGALAEATEYYSATEGDAPVFSLPLTEIDDMTGYKLPVLFINATEVQEGSPAVISNIKIDSFSKRVDIRKHLFKAGQDMRFSTAVILGARFPYVSPAGCVAGNMYFVDGGYFDNTGAGIVHEMAISLSKYIEHEKSDNPVLSKLKFQLLYISNSTLTRHDQKAIHPLSNDFLAPVLTVLGTYSSQTTVNNERLISFLNTLDSTHAYKDYNLYIKEEEEEYPMNWVISDYHLRRMDESLRRIQRDSFPKLDFIERQ